MARKSTHPIDKSKKYKLDLFKDVLPALDRRDKFYWRNREPEERKSIQPVVLQRWLTAVEKGYNAGDDVMASEYYLLMINDLVNPYLMRCHQHPELQWMMMALCGMGKQQRHSWIPMAKETNTPKLESLFKQKYPAIGRQELDTLLLVSTKESITELCEDLGMEKKEMKPYFDELKKVK